MQLVNLLCAMLISVSECYKILALLPYPGEDHQVVYEPILNELIARGHTLTVVSFFPSATSSGRRRDVSLVGLAPINAKYVDINTYDYSTYVGKTIFKILNRFAMVKKIIEDGANLCKKILNSANFQEFINAEGNYDLILVELYNSDCMLGIVHNYGLPSVGLMACNLMPWKQSWIGGDDNPALYSSMLLPFTDDISFFEKIENVFDLVISKLWYMYVSANEKELLEQKLKRKLPPLEEIGKNTSVKLVNTYYTLNGVRVPPSFIEIGGIHLEKSAAKPLLKDLENWVSESEHGLIIFSFDFITQNSSLRTSMFATISKVCKRLPQRIIWKCDTGVQNLSSNVRLMKWIPQNDLLRHRKCVGLVTHGGLLTLTEAVAAGVPMLIIPISGDQPGNAEYAKRIGIAEVLHLHDITEENLFMAMLTVLSPEMRKQAETFKILWFDRPITPMQTAMYYIEKTARYGKVKISSKSRFISNAQLIFLISVPYIIIILFLCIGILGCCLCFLSFKKLSLMIMLSR